MSARTVGNRFLRSYCGFPARRFRKKFPRRSGPFDLFVFLHPKKAHRCLDACSRRSHYAVSMSIRYAIAKLPDIDGVPLDQSPDALGQEPARKSKDNHAAAGGDPAHAIAGYEPA